MLQVSDRDYLRWVRRCFLDEAIPLEERWEVTEADVPAPTVDLPGRAAGNDLAVVTDSEGLFPEGSNFPQNLREIRRASRRRGRPRTIYLVGFQAAFKIGSSVSGPLGAAFRAFLVDALFRAGSRVAEIKAMERMEAAVGRLVEDRVAAVVGAEVRLVVAAAMRGVRPRLVGGEQTLSIGRYLEVLGVAPAARAEIRRRAMEDGFVRRGMGVSFPLREVDYDPLDRDLVFEITGLDEWWHVDGVALWAEVDPQGAAAGLRRLPRSEAGLRALARFAEPGSDDAQPSWRDSSLFPPV